MKAAVCSVCVVVLALAVSASAEVRTWKDKSGKFSIRAELVESDGTAVKLKREDGQVIKVPVDRLSDEDRKFLESLEKSAFTGAAGTTDAAKAGMAAKGAGLRYAWKTGQSYGYKVKIEVDLGDEVLEMTGSPNYSVVSADKDKTVLSFRGTLMEHQRPKAGSMGGPMMGPRGPRGMGRMGPRPGMGPRMSPFSPMTGVGPFGMARTTELTVDALGNITRQEGTSHLPFLLGNLSHLMIEPLPATDEKTWSVAHGSGVVMKEEGPPRFGPFANDEGFVPAKETTTYTIESATDKLVVVRKQYEFKAAATGADKPPFEISGDGKWTFNKAEGVSGALDFAMKVTFRKGGLSVDIPLKATYQLIDEAERAAMAKAAKEAEAERKRPLGDKELGTAVAELKSGDRFRVMRAVQQLMMKTPEKPDAEIAKALEGLVLGQDDFGRGFAAKALENWSTPANAPGLVKALDDKDMGVRVSAIKILTKYKTQEAIGPIAAKLAEGGGFVRGPAVDFLKAAGPAAEPAVIKLLENLEPGTRRDAAEVLKVIGTRQCIPALEKTATSDPNVFAKNAAKEALAAVKGREK